MFKIIPLCITFVFCPLALALFGRSVASGISRNPDSYKSLFIIFVLTAVAIELPILFAMFVLLTN